MKYFLTTILALLTVTAFAQTWEIALTAGGNYTFFLKELEQKGYFTAELPSTGGFATYTGKYTSKQSFRSNYGGSIQAQLQRSINNHWRLFYSLGGELIRYQRISRFVEMDFLSPEGEAGEWRTDPEIDLQEIYPDLGRTQLWYLHHQLGGKYSLTEKLSFSGSISGRLLIRGAEYNLVTSGPPSSQKLTTDYSNSSNYLKKIIAGLETGVHYRISPVLELEAAYSRALTPAYKKPELSTVHQKACFNQLNIKLHYLIKKY